jgi:Fur family transcriptional regulator, stress-responsive regulator
MHTDPTTDQARVLREHGLRVTRQRVSVMSALASAPHSGADAVIGAVREDVGQVSTQAVYDVLNALTARGIVRRIQPAGSTARYELRVGDHHHLVCRGCGRMVDVDCVTESAPCLDPAHLGRHAPGFVVDEAEVTFWGLCETCSPRTTATCAPYSDRSTADAYPSTHHERTA